jgi:hypothetical protein
MNAPPPTPNPRVVHALLWTRALREWVSAEGTARAPAGAGREDIERLAGELCAWAEHSAPAGLPVTSPFGIWAGNWQRQLATEGYVLLAHAAFLSAAQAAVGLLLASPKTHGCGAKAQRSLVLALSIALETYQRDLERALSAPRPTARTRAQR